MPCSVFSLFDCLFVFSEAVVDLNDPVALRTVANTTHWTALTVLRLVTADDLNIA